MKRRRRCEAIRAANVRCDHAGWIERDGRLVCGVHRWSKNPRYVEKAGKLDPCSASPIDPLFEKFENE